MRLPYSVSGNGQTHNGIHQHFRRRTLKVFMLFINLISVLLLTVSEVYVSTVGHIWWQWIQEGNEKCYKKSGTNRRQNTLIPIYNIQEQQLVSFCKPYSYFNQSMQILENFMTTSGCRFDVSRSLQKISLASSCHFECFHCCRNRTAGSDKRIP